jgi:hypothetical protein
VSLSPRKLSSPSFTEALRTVPRNCLQHFSGKAGKFMQRPGELLDFIGRICR